MSAMFWFILWAVLIVVMMRFGCGAHVMGRGHGAAPGNHERKLRWEPPKTDTDPVCGKTVNTAGAKPSVFNGFVYYFCSRECREVFEAAPRLYAREGGPSGNERLENQHG